MVPAAAGQLFHLGLRFVAFSAEVLQVVELVAPAFVQGLLVVHVSPIVQFDAAGGAPVLSDAIAYLDCRIVACHPAGDHELMLSEVVGGAILTEDVLPMNYAETGNLDGSAALYPPRF